MTDTRRFDASAYAGHSVVVLGGGGFIGRWVAKAVAEAGADTTLVVRAADQVLPMLRALGVEGRTVEADFGEPGRATEMLETLGPAITFNLIGYGVDPTERDEGVARRVNADLAGEVAEACATLAGPEWSGQRLVHVGSALEYGTAGGNLAEDTACAPTTLYGRTKLAGTEAVAEVGRRANLAAVTARLFTVYGLGEHRGRLLPSLLDTARLARPLDLTTGAQRRDFAYVEDVADGLLRLGAAQARAGEVVNLATGRLQTVRSFVETAARVLSIPAELLRFGARAGRPSEMEHDNVSIERLRQLTGWSPATSLEDGIAATAAWEAAVGRWSSG